MAAAIERNKMKLSKYKITVSALGYTDHSATLTASNKQVAASHSEHILNEWLAENDIDADSKGLASVKITLEK